MEDSTAVEQTSTIGALCPWISAQAGSHGSRDLTEGSRAEAGDNPAGCRPGGTQRETWGLEKANSPQSSQSFAKFKSRVLDVE